jgi:endonuclease G, mitochondrial
MFFRIWILVLLTAVTSCAGTTYPIIEPKPCNEFFYGDRPISLQANTTFLCHLGYATLHDNKLKAPLYSAEHLQAQNLNGTVLRTDDFRPDPQLEVGSRAELNDFKNSGFDRGHMAPAGDFNSSLDQMSESFFLSNMVAQVHSFNAGIWERLETSTRSCAKSLGDVFVLTGTIFDATSTTIGVGQVVVPTHLFKIIYDPTSGNSRAFIMPNSAISGAFRPWQVSIDEVELRTGLDVFPQAMVNESELGTLCASLY